MSIKCDNNSIIILSKNSVLHSRTRYIDVRHHFIKDQVLNKTVFFDYVCAEKQIVDIFTKPLNEERFCDLRRELGIFDPFSWMNVSWRTFRKVSCYVEADSNRRPSRL